MITRGLDPISNSPSWGKGYKDVLRAASVLDNLALKTALIISMEIKMNTPKPKMRASIENEGFVIPKASCMTGSWIKILVRTTCERMAKMSHRWGGALKMLYRMERKFRAMISSMTMKRKKISVLA